MTWISLVCLLALSSSALARSVSYGSYGGVQVPSMNLVRDFTSQQQKPILPQSSYGQQQNIVLPSQEDQTTQPEIQPIQSGYGQQYGGQQMIRKPIVQFDQGYNKVQLPAQRSYVSQAQLLQDQKQKLQQLIQESTVLTEADILCRGQAPETVIPLDNGRRFVVCIDESKGQEQQCPRGLLFHQESRRCERKLGPLENPCSSQPCLNNGQCVQTDFSSYKCQCAPGYDGQNCELDATVCQTQQPCGQSQDTKCQSFRWGAALQHICILQGGRAYGLTASQAQPSPCTGVDGTFPLAFSDKGFIMCNGDLMFVESCPGGTVWDDLNKACVWPDMQGLSFEDQTPKVPAYGASSYNTVPRTSQYGAQQQFDTPMKPVHSYGQSHIKSFTQPKLIPQQDEVQQYGQQQIKPFTLPKPIPQQDEVQQYGQQQIKPFTQPKLIQQQDEVSQYGKMQLPVQQDQIQQQPTYGGYQQQIPKQIFQQPIQRQQDFLRPTQQSSY
ncbi:hypothetical protein I4U23_027773 [Adineta vaga]|nr:hypothetical protein I4U23_027773 [Adineta vaga]